MKTLLITFTLLSMSAAIMTGWSQISFSVAPALPAIMPLRWPSESSLPWPTGVATLILFAHPGCPCTHATLCELAKVIEHSGPPLRVIVLFTRPIAGPAENWQETDTWRQASRLAGAAVAWDDGGCEAARFGARASGQILLFDAAGNLRFDGGITCHRGQEGGNGFSNAMIHVLNGHAGERVSTPVFGCPLVLPPNPGL